MENIIPSLEDETLSVKTIYPNPEEFKNDHDKKEEKKKDVESRVDESCDIVGITHTDADGYGCGTILKYAFQNKDVRIVTAKASGPKSIKNVGDFVSKNIDEDTKVYIMDLSPNSDISLFIDSLKDYDLTIIDHHSWLDGDINYAEQNADLILDTNKCATRIAYDELTSEDDLYLDDFVEITEDHDLWIKDREKESDDLSELANILTIDEYISIILEYGSDAINEKSDIINESIEEKQEKNRIAESRSEFKQINGYSFCISYGRCNPSSFGDNMMEKYGLDLVCVIFPSGKLSFRSKDGSTIARDIARMFGGNGHPCAAGAHYEFSSKEDIIHNWVLKGEKIEKEICEKIKSIE